MSEEDTKNSDAEAELQEPLLSVKEDEPVLAAPVAEEVIRTTDAEVVEPSHVPMEKWKDGLCDCFTNVGCCHQSTICACCCPLAAAGQVLSRLGLSVIGKRISKEGAKKQFTFLLVLSIVASIMQLFVQGEEPSQALIVLNYVFGILVSIFGIIILVVARSATRKRDKIPTGCFGALEDCIASWCCNCCTTAQLMRQTADYKEVDGAWFTHDGLPGTDSV